MPLYSRSTTLSERFWPLVDKNGPAPAHCPELGACWVWTRSKHTFGYGKIGINYKTFGTHCVAWELTYGPIPDGQWVLHKCDNPPCVRPDHLFLGTQADNMADRDAKHRLPTGDAHWSRRNPERVARGLRSGKYTKPEATPRGERHGLRKHPELAARGERANKSTLTEQDVRDIRRLYAERQANMYELAARYGISRPAVGYIIKRKTWQHVV